ncbi:acyl-CoA dehydrogenase family protein [Nonomuraea sp. NPDC050227]|uniref:acyl-CoA dehydrogenase family protein n=1 Tax=Nonomuraea sp. NPDC050227 TaxID=3364360 RepID=UPI003790784A
MMKAIATELVPVLAQHATKTDAEAAFPHEGVQALRQSGLFGLLVPAGHGGMGGDLGDLVDVAALHASGRLPTTMIWAMHRQQVDVIERPAGERLRTELLPGKAQEGYCLASVTTEPAKCGDLLSAHSAFLTEDENLLVRRSAPVMTGGEYADAFLITMRAGPDASRWTQLLALIRSEQRSSGISMDSDLVRHRLARARIGLHLSGMYLLRMRDKVRRRLAGAPLNDRPLHVRLDALKVACTELTFSAVDRLVQLGGAMTRYQRDTPVPLERHFRDVGRLSSWRADLPQPQPRRPRCELRDSRKPAP